MKKLFIILSLSFILTGCAVLETQKANWQACKLDPVCLAQAKGWQETGELLGTTAGSVVPGAAPITQKVGGYIAFAIAMLLGGRAFGGVPIHG